MSVSGILQNLLSDVLFLLLLIFLGWLFHLSTGRKRLLQFFGIKKPHRLVVYLSNLRVKPFGTLGIDGIERSYQGIAAAYGEMTVANRFRDLFNYLLPSLSDNPGILSKLLISDVQVKVIHSPLTEGEIEKVAPFVTLGSSAFNVVSRLAEKRLGSKVSFNWGVTRLGNNEISRVAYEPTAYSTQGTTTVIVPSGIPTGTSSAFNPNQYGEDDQQEVQPSIQVEGIPPITDRHCGIIERVFDRENKRAAFYVAGLSEHSTTGAAFYLLTEWSRLHTRFGIDLPFLVMLRFEHSNYENWSVLFEKQ